MNEQESQPQAAKSSEWIRYLIYLLASFGALAMISVIYSTLRDQPPKRLTIDESETIDQVMSRTYGKYSDQHKGWLYVGAGNQNYVMRVVQQTKIPDYAEGDELYFVASGTPLDGKRGALVGVFYIRPDSNRKEPKLVEISEPYYYPGDVPVTPEKVLFEALSEHTWGWMIKAQTGVDPKKELVHVQNVLLAPRQDDIAILAQFHASVDYDPGIDCAEANRRYEAWVTAQDKPKVITDGETKEASEDEVIEEPLRCSKARWTFKVGPVTGDAFSPLYITGKGTRDGEPVSEKQVKVMFDSKSFSYLIPRELAVD